jgi:TetR/AcrR family transcriptional regulator
VADKPAAEPIRERLLAAAEAVFARMGYAAATTQEIARLAGIQKRMLFYYFPGKEDLYLQVLHRFLGGIRDIHARIRQDPGPVGIQEIIAGVLRLIAANPNPVRILVREIMDDGPHLRHLVKSYVGPLFADGLRETQRNIDRGVFNREDPMHTLINVGGLTVFYLIVAPLLKQVWHRDPLAPDTIEDRIEATVRFVLGGLGATGGIEKPGDEAPPAPGGTRGTSVTRAASG